MQDCTHRTMFELYMCVYIYIIKCLFIHTHTHTPALKLLKIPAEFLSISESWFISTCSFIYVREESANKVLRIILSNLAYYLFLERAKIVCGILFKKIIKICFIYLKGKAAEREITGRQISHQLCLTLYFLTNLLIRWSQLVSGRFLFLCLFSP